ncbi:MAG: OB-fold domain-containing protein [Candidatus Peribacteraceae bacterium]|nr:OB-fold domain-containing protein [Candidatus Peribacteraceae bacterium]
MTHTPASIARALRSRPAREQEGEILSFTTVTHPPARFGSSSRIIGLIALDDRTKVMGRILGGEPAIGQRVRSRLRLSHTTEQKLKVYDVCYEILVGKSAPKPFPGYILALTGPSGVGKTTISMLLTTTIGDYASKVPILTTRDLKKGDEQEYRQVTMREFVAQMKRGEIVAATKIPSSSEQRWYGYRAADIETIWNEGKIPVVVTEMGLLQGLAHHYSRRSILSLGLLPPGKSKRTMLSCLLHRLRSRGRDSEESISDRLKNAERDLQFFEDRCELFDHVIVNEDLSAACSNIVNHVMELAKP